MSLLEVTAIGIQIILPLAMIAWMLFLPLRCRLGFIVQASTTFLVVLALMHISLWIIPPWWTPYSYLIMWGLILVKRAPVIWRFEQILPKKRTQIVSVLLLLPLSILAGSFVIQAFQGRYLSKDSQFIDIDLPLGPGTYLVANGGSTAIINGHFRTLHPKTEQHRAYRGQSFAIDLVKVNSWGMRALGWRPREPADYFIFAEPVYSPCSGTVVSAQNDLPDMPVPVPDKTLLEGNHVVLDCGEFLVLLAHLRKGSLLKQKGDSVKRREKVGEVGNSGNSFEPHLHLHIQRHADVGEPILSGEPVHVTFGGKMPYRNMLMQQHINTY